MKNNFKTNLAIVGLAGLLTFGCGNPATIEKTEDKTLIRIAITQTYYPKNEIDMLYSGMNSKDSVFFISNPIINSAVPITYPTTVEEFTYFGKTYDLEKVTPDSLIISFTK